MRLNDKIKSNFSGNDQTKKLLEEIKEINKDYECKIIWDD